MKSIKPVSFIEFLLQASFINQTIFEKIKFLIYQEIDDQEKIKEITNLTLLDPKKIKNFYEKYSTYEQTDLNMINPKNTNFLPEKIAIQKQAFIFDEKGGIFWIAMSNPSDISLVDSIALIIKKSFKIFLAKKEVIEKKIHDIYRGVSNTHQLSHIASLEVEQYSNDLTLISQTLDSNSSPIEKILNIFIEDALIFKASDIHIEASRENIFVRYRLAGSLLKQADLNIKIKDMLIRHILSRSNGNLSAMQTPQDTSFSYQRKNGDFISIRVSTLVSINGYSIVMRLLKSQTYSKLDDTISSPPLLDAIRLYIQQGNGMFIVSGPTSSGKTTMLYNILNDMTNKKEVSKKILSIEDPVEAILNGVTQISVDEKNGLDFSDIIKVSLRQNPDVLMLGEIRDNNSALMAMRASITGVMVLSTLHTRDSTEVILRLHDLGVPLPMLGNSLKLITATRLLRCLCETCKKTHILTKKEYDTIRALSPTFQQDESTIFQSTGCASCHFTGYQGTHPIYEFLLLDQELTASLSNQDILLFKAHAKKKLYQNKLIDHSIKLWMSGLVDYKQVSSLIF